MKTLLAAIAISAAISNFGLTAHADDCDFIRSAIQNMPAQGGTIEVPAGIFVCDRPIILDHEHATLRGQGFGSVLKLADNVNAPVIVMGQVETPPKQIYGVTVRDLKIDGNRDHQQGECWGGDCDAGGTAYIRNNGITVRGITNGRIENVYITRPRSGGVVSEKGCYNLQIDGLTVSESYFDGFAGYETYGSKLKNLHFFSNNAAGISIDIRFHGNTIENALIENNRDVGIFMRDSNDNLFKNVTIRNAGNHGIFLAADDTGLATCPTNNEFRDLTVENSRGVGFRLNDACEKNRLTGRALFRANRDGCISEGTATKIGIAGSFICD